MLHVAVEVNHITIPAKDKRASAQLLAYILGLEVELEAGLLVRVRASGEDGHGLTLNFSDDKNFRLLQCAFLVSVSEFDAALTRIKREAIRFYSKFDGTGACQINRLHGGRGVYFDDANGHLFELIEQSDGTAADSRIKAVAIKLTRKEFRSCHRSSEKNVARGTNFTPNCGC
jgi:catechol 2,3-dioxygenase-like lactoylglutathione lyase family enzyme